MCVKYRGEPSARVACRIREEQDDARRDRVKRVNEHRLCKSLLRRQGMKEEGCPDTTCGAATTSGTHVQESSGFYPATRPLAPPFVPYTHTRTHIVTSPSLPANSSCQMAAHGAMQAPTGGLRTTIMCERVHALTVCKG